MSEQGLSRADVIATKPAELRVLDDRTKGQEFVYSLNTDGVANGLAVFGKENIKPELLPHFEGLQPLVAYLTGVVESLVHREAFEMVANITKEVATTCDPIFGIFTSSFLACSNSGDFKFHLDSKNSTFGINFSVVVDEEDTEPPVVWPALYLPDRNVVIPAVHGEAIVSMFKHEKHGTRMWHSGERRFVEVAELAAEADTRKQRISLILADGMGTASWAVKRNQDRFVGSAVVEKRGVTFNINRDATDCNRKIRESVLQALG
ncbi:hypothetical protein BDR26DRAFT_924686 [Obelidium mucronatum]|nr:hypothetical protein BDR26DRAFT_957971 [Obelidium mucronatum]KAI9326075.1 hypothetical protein BDR26DRAFT_924686 [Obelidium mucronatum]